MLTCVKCQITYEDDSTFCRKCGKVLIDLPTIPYCPKCEIEYTEVDRFCRECGGELAQKPVLPAQTPDVSEAAAPSPAGSDATVLFEPPQREAVRPPAPQPQAARPPAGPPAGQAFTAPAAEAAGPQGALGEEKKMGLSRLLFSFRGRIPRAAFWLKFSLPYMVIYFLLLFWDIASGALQEGGFALYSGIFSLLAIYPSLAVAVKRCHDRGRTGWFLLVGIIPLVNLWVAIELGFLRGTEGENKYGDDPLG